MRRHLLAPLLAFSVACAPAGDAERTAAPRPVDRADTLPAIRALGALTSAVTWTGPANGPGREVVTLFADGTFRQRTVSGAAGPAGAGKSSVGHGRWELTRGAARLTLYGGREAPQWFAIQDTITLRALATDGTERPGAPSIWSRAATVDPIGDVAPMVGAFVYYADAAILTECESGRQYPVAMEGGYRELERQYGASVAAGGSPLVVRLRTRLRDAPAGEGDGRATAVIVDSLERIDADGACAALTLRRAVDGVTWRLRELEGVPADPSLGRGSPSITLELAEGRIAGSDGCNRYSGRGVLRGVDLVVGPLAGTRMRCLDEGVTFRADRFLRALGEGGWLRLDGTTLVLSRGPHVVARFFTLADRDQR